MLTSDIMLELHVPDFELTKKFYSDLGFKVVWEREPEEKKGYLVMKNDVSILNFFCGNEHVYEQTYFKRFPKTTVRGYGVEIIIPTDDIHTLYKNIQSKHPDSIVQKLKIRFDKYDFRIIDPFGYYLRFVERYDWVNKDIE